MADEQPTSSSPSAVNLQIVSPSVGVNTLSFPGLAAATTVRELKEKIRDVLPSRPAHDQQRLIHRGRLLARDSDTLQTVFGEEMLRTGEQQTLHLVLRDTTEHHPHSHTSSPTPLRGQSPAPGNAPSRPESVPPHAQPQRPYQPQAYQHIRAHALRSGPAMNNPMTNPQMSQFMQQNMTHMLLQQQQQQQQQIANAAIQQQHQTMVQWMNHLQREAGYRQLYNQQLGQQQRERAFQGYHGIQDNANNAQPPGEQTDGRSNPAVPPAVQTFSWTTADGVRRRVAVNDPSTGQGTPNTQFPPGSMGAGPTSNPGVRGPLSPADVHNIIRGADATQATQAMTNAMHRSASGASLSSLNNITNINGPIQPIQPGVTTPLYPGVSRHASRTATPDPSARPVSNGSSSLPGLSQNPNSAPLSHGQPEVYILSSPNGPRGLLISNGSDMYVTPALRQLTVPQFPLPGGVARHQQPQTFVSSWSSQVQTPPVQQQQGHVQGHGQPQPQPQQPFRQPLQPHQLQIHNQPPQVQPQQAQRFAALRPMQAHPNVNPGAGALLVAAWPHIWLLIRLVLFVWWFTSDDTSLYQWLAMIGIATVVFVLNTGMFNGVANQVWEPLRQHLEGLLPDPNRRRDPPPPAGLQQQPPNGPATATTTTTTTTTTGGRRPDPAQTVARLVANRRNAHANWLLDQVRRIERAGLLFLASIAPGVAERHIAHLEAQERADRQRRVEEEAAANVSMVTNAFVAANASAAAATAAATEEGRQQSSGQEEQQHSDGGAGGGEGAPAPQGGLANADHQAPAQLPLPQIQV
ncbi:hypothetical protein B0T17DRAFT_53448 [Bombardia bombarda]|uniref:Ubiquitin-like domain-containing protein n=1 Tax=Bombardia bombarda TaxID=252184 RepID=A0AA40CFM6_9PEZI|nr:hypothetical protein B0T17DRAFT_53448 [Bombardia bombarda]